MLELWMTVHGTTIPTAALVEDKGFCLLWRSKQLGLHQIANGLMKLIASPLCPCQWFLPLINIDLHGHAETHGDLFHAR